MMSRMKSEAIEMTDIKEKAVTDSITPQTLKAEYVSPENCSFFANGEHFLGMKLDGKEYKRVILMRALPLNRPESYICITDVERNELGIIENISDFPAEQRELIKRELSMRYFCPEVTAITSVKEKMGHFYFDVLIGDYKRSFTIKDLSKNIRCSGNSVTLTDVDGNRFVIGDIRSISRKSRRKLEPYLY